MKNDELMGSATAVALEIFDLFRFVGDEAIFDLNGAIAKIEAYGDRRAREALRPRRAKVVPLRMVGRS
jgi:hypothetical protein